MEQCPGGCGQTVNNCLCKQIEEAKKQIIFNPPPPDTTVNTYNKNEEVHIRHRS